MLLGGELSREMTLCRSTPTRIMTTKIGIKTQSRIALSRNKDCSCAILLTRLPGKKGAEDGGLGMVLNGLQ